MIILLITDIDEHHVVFVTDFVNCKPVPTVNNQSNKMKSNWNSLKLTDCRYFMMKHYKTSSSLKWIMKNVAKKMRYLQLVIVSFSTKRLFSRCIVEFIIVTLVWIETSSNIDAEESRFEYNKHCVKKRRGEPPKMQQCPSNSSSETSTLTPGFYEDANNFANEFSFSNNVLFLKVLIQEFYALQHKTDKQISSLETETREKTDKLKTYEKLEQELDDVIMQSAESECSNYYDNQVFTRIGPLFSQQP